MSDYGKDEAWKQRLPSRRADETVNASDTRSGLGHHFVPIDRMTRSIEFAGQFGFPAAIVVHRLPQDACKVTGDFNYSPFKRTDVGTTQKRNEIAELQHYVLTYS